MIEIYTDGAYSSSKNIGGWAFLIIEDNLEIFKLFGPIQNTTNNRAELFAVIKSIEWCINNNISNVHIYTDSMYIVGTMTKNWKRNKNTDLWNQLDNLIKNIKINWKHVKGHNGNILNERCDLLATQAINII